MGTTATAAVLHGKDEPFVLEQVTLDDPRPDEVLVRITAAGVCDTDLGVQAQHVRSRCRGCSATRVRAS